MAKSRVPLACRTCLAEAPELNNIFETSIEFETETLRISDIISICTGLQIDAGDELTKYVCQECDQEITRYYMFRKKCYEADVVLKMKRETSDVSLIIEDIFGSPIEEDVEEDEPNDDDANSRHSDDNQVDYKDDISESYYYNSLDENDTDDASCEIKLIETDKTDPFELQKQLSPVNVPPPKPQSKRIRKRAKQMGSDETDEPGEIKTKVRLNQFPSPQKCEFCSRTFLSIASYTSHMTSHKNKKEFLCNICGQVFRTKSTHRDHMYRHDANRNKCTVCDKNFSSPFQLRLHMFKHTGEKPHKCDVCGAAYSQKSYFKIHMRTHTGEKPYKCHYCDKTFAACNARTKHERDHQDPALRPFQCHICPKNFRKKENYNKHLLTHTGEKSQKCPYCDKAFLFRKGLVVHIRTHTGEKPHECSFCSKRFTQRHCLNSHIFAHHKYSSNAGDVAGNVEDEEDEDSSIEDTP